MDFDLLSFVLGALLHAIAVVVWCWVRGARRPAGYFVADDYEPFPPRGFQPTTQSANPQLPDGSEAVSVVQDDSRAAALLTQVQRHYAEWRRGCSCASVAHPDECEHCTRAFLVALSGLLEPGVRLPSAAEARAARDGAYDNVRQLLRGYQPKPQRCGRTDEHEHHVGWRLGPRVRRPAGAAPCDWPRDEPPQHPPSGASAASGVTGGES